MHGMGRGAVDSANQVAVLLSEYAPYLQECRARLISGLSEVPFGSTLSGYFQNGKMLRALLVFLGAAAVGGESHRVMAAAESAELAHGASLFHDDIIDEAEERRGLTALHLQVGAPAALVLGDHLLLRSFSVLTTAQMTHPLPRVLEAIHMLGYYGQECCRGQLAELAPDEDADPEAAYFSLVQGKTAALFAAAVSVGAVLEGGTVDQVAALRRYGQSIGVAFQIRDDVLDLTGDEAKLGKPVGNSLENDRPMLPLIYLQRYGSPASQAEYTRFRKSGADRVVLATLLHREHIFDRVRETQEHLIEDGLQALNSMPHSGNVEALRLFSVYAANWGEPVA